MSDSPSSQIISRRRLLQGGAVAVAGGAAYGVIRSRQAVSGARAKVLIVGGGSAGISVAARLSHALAYPDITLVDPSAEHYYQPGFTMIGGGVFDAAEVVRPQAELIPEGVRWVRDRVAAIDPDGKRAVTAGSGALTYDFLVLCPGVQMNYDAVPGLRREDLGKGNVHSIYDYQGAQKCWKAVEQLARTGGRACFTDTWTKAKCGGAPKKINLMAEHLCRKYGTRARTEMQYFSALDHLMDAPVFQKRLAEVYAERGIPVHYKHRILQIDPERRTVTFERTGTGGAPETLTREFDFLHVVPPMSAPDFVKASALALNPKTGKAEDWVPTHPATLVHARYGNVCVLGDVAGIPTSKTAAAIRSQAPVVTANLIALMENREPAARYNGYTACPVITEYGKVLLAEFGYDKKPAPTVPLADPAREHRFGWLLKRYALKPLYFEGMLRGRA